jgi:predicted NUDIX family phosphoesterase
MALKAFVLSREALVQSSVIPEQTAGQALYIKFQDRNDLATLLELAENSGVYRERGGENSVENDPSVQQLIVYGYVQLADGKFMLYQRGHERYDESRLAGRVSLGVGGHMEPTDLSLFDAFYREIDEETVLSINGQVLDFKKPDDTTDIALMRQYVTIEPKGLIKDERDPVGELHLGIACKIIPQVGVDLAIRTVSGESLSSLYVDINQYDTLVQSGEIVPEGWTNIVVDNELRHSA